MKKILIFTIASTIILGGAFSSSVAFAQGYDCDYYCASSSSSYYSDYSTYSSSSYTNAGQFAGTWQRDPRRHTVSYSSDYSYNTQNSSYINAGEFSGTWQRDPRRHADTYSYCTNCGGYFATPTYYSGSYFDLGQFAGTWQRDPRR